MTHEEERWLTQVEDWMRRDATIRRLVISCLGDNECADVRFLLEREPGVFEELYEAIETMVEDEPIHESDGFYR